MMSAIEHGADMLRKNLRKVDLMKIRADFEKGLDSGRTKELQETLHTVIEKTQAMDVRIPVGLFVVYRLVATLTRALTAPAAAFLAAAASSTKTLFWAFVLYRLCYPDAPVWKIGHLWPRQT